MAHQLDLVASETRPSLSPKFKSGAYLIVFNDSGRNRSYSFYVVLLHHLNLETGPLMHTRKKHAKHAYKKNHLHALTVCPWNFNTSHDRTALHVPPSASAWA